MHNLQRSQPRQPDTFAETAGCMHEVGCADRDAHSVEERLGKLASHGGYGGVPWRLER